MNFTYNYAAQKDYSHDVGPIHYTVMKTIKFVYKQSQVQAIILLYFIPRLLITHEVAVYDIFRCRHTEKYTH